MNGLAVTDAGHSRKAALKRAGQWKECAEALLANGYLEKAIEAEERAQAYLRRAEAKVEGD